MMSHSLEPLVKEIVILEGPTSEDFGPIFQETTLQTGMQIAAVVHIPCIFISKDYFHLDPKFLQRQEWLRHQQLEAA
jgi:hypothetical protein